MSEQHNDHVRLAEQRVSSILAKHSSNASQRFRRLFRNYAAAKADYNPVKLLNGFWRLQLGYLQRDTYTEREHLVENVDLDNWMTFFENKILPTVLEEDLPRAI